MLGGESERLWVRGGGDRAVLGADRAEWRGREPKLVRHGDGLMLTLLLETWNHRRSHAVLPILCRKQESLMSVRGCRRTPRNDIGEMLKHSEMSSQQPRHKTRRDQSKMTCELLLKLVTPKALLGSS